MVEYRDVSATDRIRSATYQLAYASSIVWGTGIIYSAAHLDIRGVVSFSIITAADLLVANAFRSVQKEEDMKKELSRAPESQYEQLTELQASQTFFLEGQGEHQSQ